MELEKERESNGDSKKRGRKVGQRQRTTLEQARDRAEMVKLRLRYRMLPKAIAAKINEFYKDEEDSFNDNNKLVTRPHVSDKQVWVELKAATEEFKEAETDEILTHRLQLIRSFEDLALQAQEAFDASKENELVKVTESRSNKEKGDSELTRETIKHRVEGNPRFLEVKDNCLREIGKLRAAYPPQKTALTNPEGTEPYKFELPEEQKRLNALMSQFLEAKDKEEKP